MPHSFDAVLLLSFGGPEQPDDVVPFLRNVTRGRNIPEARLAQVAKQYELFGGRSPINDQCRSMMTALSEELEDRGVPLPLYWGNRNWHPYLSDTLAEMHADGVTNALVYVTSIFGSYSGCRQYQEEMEAARALLPDAPELHKLRLFYNHPGFIAAQAAQLDDAIGSSGLVDPDDRDPGGTSPTVVLFCAHSLPTSQAAHCQYEAQLANAAALVMDHSQLAGRPGVRHEIVYQSRSGPPSMPWLEPDINDRLEELAAGDTSQRVIVVPIGFVSDNAEVMFDLDVQATATAERLGLPFLRVPTVGTHPRFVAGIADLIDERLDSRRPRLALGSDPAWPDICPAGHCLSPTPQTGHRPR